MKHVMPVLAAAAALFLVGGLSPSLAQTAPATPAPAGTAPAVPAAPAPNPPGPARATPPAAPAAAGAETRRPRSYGHCIRASRKRKLTGAERRRFVARCQLGYASPPRMPSGTR